MQDQVFDVSELLHDAPVTLKKNITVYGHVTRTRARYFLYKLLAELK
jgi:hypothetical protein